MRLIWRTRRAPDRSVDPTPDPSPFRAVLTPLPAALPWGRPVAPDPTAWTDPIPLPEPTRPDLSDRGAGPDPVDPPHRRLPESDPTGAPDPTPSSPTGRGSGSDEESGRDWVVDLGLAIGGLAAIVASFSALTGLARLVGWGELDWLLPVTVDSFAITATRVWMTKRTRSRKVRRFAMANAVGAIGLSLAGNAAFHAIDARAWDPGRHLWLLVVAVSSIPPIAIGLISHLAVLRGRDAEFAAAEEAEQAVPEDRAARPDSAPTRPAEADPTPAPDPVEARPDPTGTPPIAPGPILVEATTPTDPTAAAVQVDPAPVEAERPDRLPAVKAPVEASASTRPGAPDSTRPGAPDSTGPAGWDEEMLELLRQARALDDAHYAKTGKHLGADPLREALGVGSKRARMLRDAVRGLHAVDPTASTGREAV